MQTIDVLFGFDLPEFEKGIEKYMNSLGYEVNSAVKLTKNSINEYLVANPGCNTAVLVEKIGGSCYSEDELAMLTDKRDINIIVLLDEKNMVRIICRHYMMQTSHRPYLANRERVLLHPKMFQN